MDEHTARLVHDNLVVALLRRHHRRHRPWLVSHCSQNLFTACNGGVRREPWLTSECRIVEFALRAIFLQFHRITAIAHRNSWIERHAYTELTQFHRNKLYSECRMWMRCAGNRISASRVVR